jgi:hypothetical protein
MNRRGNMDVPETETEDSRAATAEVVDGFVVQIEVGTVEVSAGAIAQPRGVEITLEDE